MFRKLLATIGLLLLLGPALEAKPFWKKKVFWVSTAVGAAASLVDTKEAHDCRQRVGISFCSGGYGPFAARQALNFGANVGFNLLAAWGQDLGVKESYALPFAFTAYNIYDAYDQTLKGCPAGQWPVYGTKYNCTGPTGPKDWNHIRPIKLPQLTGAR